MSPPLYVRGKSFPSFSQALAASDKSGVRVATLPDLALLRAKATKPHAPKKPWETYRDGTSPLWENWWMSASFLFMGKWQGASLLVVSHRFDVTSRSRDRFLWEGDECFHLDERAWARLVEEAPPHQKLVPAGVPEFPRNGESGYAASEMRSLPVFRALLGESLEAYTEAHRLIAMEYLTLKLEYVEALDRMTSAQLAFVKDPPIVGLDLGGVLRKMTVPETGAVGGCLSMEGMVNAALNTIPLANTRSADIGLSTPTDSTKFVLVHDGST